jgi:hypothetical protein
VIDFQPVQRRRPQIRLVAPQGVGDPHNPPHYVWLRKPWTSKLRSLFDRLGPDAFAAEYLYLVAQYQAEIAMGKHGRPYWFMPLARLARAYQLSEQFAGRGLRALVRLGAMSVTPGQYGRKNDEFAGAANRYYFGGVESVEARAEKLRDLKAEHDATVFRRASRLALKLLNGATATNVERLCALINQHGARRVESVLKSVDRFPPRSLYRRVGYLAAVLASSKDRARRGRSRKPA